MHKTLLLVLYFAFTAVLCTKAQDKVYRIGVFASLYLDSAFLETEYRFDNQMPRYMLPGLEFVQGAMMAMDSVKSAQIRLQVYDIRSAGQTLENLKAKGVFDSLNLMIGAVTGTDYRTMAALASAYRIPFVSATFPNDGGIRNNPYTIIINTTLPEHIRAIYQFLLKVWPTANLIWIRKKGVMEDRLANYLNDLNKGNGNSKLLNIRPLTVPDSFGVREIVPLLDSNRTNVIIAGSLDENFGRLLASASQQLMKTYKPVLVGMPTWENIKELQRPEMKEIEIYYTTTFYMSPASRWTNDFVKLFSEKTYARPSDLAGKGFELTYYFANLLLKHEGQVMRNLSDKSYRLFTDFDFKPVAMGGTGTDYIENKKIYLLKRQNNTLTRIN